MLIVASGFMLLFAQSAAAVAITVPFGTAVADADLDGNPATGAWGDALSTTVPLENAAASPYGSATLLAKHDGTFVYFRIDGSIDVPWSSATGNHFWLGVQMSPAGTSHHGGGTWDGVFFGLWDGTNYVPQATYPPVAVDTNGFSRPPAKDAVQDAVGKMGVSGTAKPYAFTAEWKKKLNTGDTNDLVLLADGTTTYRFFVTTDSDGGGSSGGAIAHDGVTNANTMRFATPPASNTPPQVSLSTPNGGQAWSGGSSHAIAWTMSDAETATPSLVVWINASTDGGTTFSPIPGAQGVSGFSSPCSFAWALPLVNTTQARVRVTVADAQSATATASSSANFAIDSSTPTVTSVSPSNGAVGVLPTASILVTFSEPMNQTNPGMTVSLQRIDTSAFAAGAFSWAGNGVTFTPSAALSSGVTYRVQVNTTAKDASDPGNPLATMYVSTFTTVVLSPPFQSVSVVPSVQEAGLPVNITVQIVSGITLASLNVTIQDAAGHVVFRGSLLGTTGLYWIEVSFRVLGPLNFVLAAKESAGKVTTAEGNFTIVDTRPPVAVAGPDRQVWLGSTVEFNASASHDNSAIVNVTWSFRYNGTDVLLYGAFANFTFGVVGRYNVTLHVTDAAKLTGTAGVNVTVITDTTPPPAPANLLVLAVAPACLKVTWEASAASDLAGYRLYRWNRTRATFDLIANLPADATTYTDCGLEDNTVYSYWAIAFDRSGNPSPPSPIDNGRTLAPASNGSSSDPLYQTIIALLLVVVLMLAVLWVEERSRRRTRPPRR